MIPNDVVLPPIAFTVEETQEIARTSAYLHLGVDKDMLRLLLAEAENDKACRERQLLAALTELRDTKAERESFRIAIGLKEEGVPIIHKMLEYRNRSEKSEAELTTLKAKAAEGFEEWYRSTYGRLQEHIEAGEVEPGKHLTHIAENARYAKFHKDTAYEAWTACALRYEAELAKIRELLAPVCAEETILGAIRNLQQAARMEAENCETLQGKLASSKLETLREAAAAMCPWCRDLNPEVEQKPDSYAGQWYHRCVENRTVTCEAGPIVEMIESSQ